MPQFIVGSEADIAAIEATVFCYNLRYVAGAYNGGVWVDRTVEDTRSLGDDGYPIGIHPGAVDVDGLTDQQLGDRSRFALYPVDADGNVLFGQGPTERWDVPHAVTREDSPYFGEYVMPLPAINHPYDAETISRLEALWGAVIDSFPDAELIEADHADLFAEGG